MIIGIAGKKRAGKDTFATYIKHHFGDTRKVEIFSFAFALKMSAARSLGFEGEDIECVDFCNDLKEAATIKVEWDNEALKASPDTITSHWEGWEISGREYLQLYGTEAHREIFDDGFWVDYLMNRIAYFHDNPSDFALITDVRYDNEAELCDSVVEIVRPSLDNGEQDSHKSEQPISRDLIDYTVLNDKGLDNLYIEGICFMDKILYPTEVL